MLIRFRGAPAIFLAGLLALILLTGACKKETVAPPPAVPPPAPPAPAAPTATLRANPEFIQHGEASMLTWSSTNATDLNLAPGIGRVAPEGSVRVTPQQSTTYILTAGGPGGSTEASARVTVGAAPPPPPPARPAATIEELFRANVFDAFYDFDKADVRPDARNALAKTAEFLRGYPQIRVTIEGHCDERGSTEYNLALGDRRAQAARQFLISLGVTPERLNTVSWGKERPFCTQSAEDCWQQNRRAHFVMAR
jgi:peptidoglycan-associated lipoprotein